MQIATDSEQNLRVALLGCGRIARLAHLSILRGHTHANLVAIADSDSDSRSYASQCAPGVQLFQDFNLLLREAKPDAVVIAMPTLMHREAAVAALSAGAHVYLEKPIAASLNDANAIHAAWTQTTLVGRMGFNARFGHLYRKLKEKLECGEIGKPVVVRSAFTARFPAESTWRMSPSTGGGALLELASHHVDLMRFIFNDEIVSVSATTWSNRGDDESAMIHLTMASGIRAQMFAAYGTLEEDRFEVYGEEGKLVVDRYDSLAVETTGPYAKGGLSAGVARLSAELGGMSYGMKKRRAQGQEPSFAESIGDFLIGASRHNRRSPDFADGLRALEVIDAARRSASEHRTVVLR